MNLFSDHILLIGLVTLLLAGVLVFFLISQHNLKASTRRIKEEFGQPGERDTLPVSVEPPAQSWDAAVERPTADVMAELDAKIERANYLVKSAAEQIKRLENLIAQSEQIGRAADPALRDQPPVG